MLKQIVNRFPGISCAYVDATGKVTTEYYGVSDKELSLLWRGFNKSLIMNIEVTLNFTKEVLHETG